MSKNQDFLALDQTLEQLTPAYKMVNRNGKFNDDNNDDDDDDDENQIIIGVVLISYRTLWLIVTRNISVRR